MRAKIREVLATDQVEVWFYTDNGYVFYAGNPDWRAEKAEDGVATTPSLVLPKQALVALQEAAADFKPPSTSQANHLRDAITVRDRLLTLVERATFEATNERRTQ